MQIVFKSLVTKHAAALYNSPSQHETNHAENHVCREIFSEDNYLKIRFLSRILYYTEFLFDVSQFNF